MEYNNKDKYNHGQYALKSLYDIIETLHNIGVISSHKTNYRISKYGFPVKQFHAPYLLSFVNGEKWAVYSTTSMRTDRIKGNQWDSLNLKIIDPLITKSIIVYPDSVPLKIQNEFIRKNLLIENHEEYSSIDMIISQSSFNNLIVSKFLANQALGISHHTKGIFFEKSLAAILNYEDNLEIFNAVPTRSVGIYYPTFKKVLDCLNIIPGTAKRIYATSDRKEIGILPSNGNPKTDVLVQVELSDGTLKTHTISCKRSSRNKVSVHQYNADTFADVLDPSNSRLRTLLNEFQTAGSLGAFDSQLELTEALHPYKEKLAHWALGGYYGAGDEKKHWAQYIVTLDDNTGKISMHSVFEYYNLLINSNIKGNFGTVFSWTYASKQRGKSIQLKTHII